MTYLGGRGAGSRAPLHNAAPLVPVNGAEAPGDEALRWAHPFSVALTKGIPVGFFSSAD